MNENLVERYNGFNRYESMFFLIKVFHIIDSQHNSSKKTLDQTL